MVSRLEFARSNTFTNNKAAIEGGAIYWDYIEPLNILTPTFTNNSAGKYGDNIASFPQKLLRISEAEYLSALKNKRALSTESYTGTDLLKLTNQKSGGVIPTTYLALVDKYGQKVASDSVSTVKLAINQVISTSTYTPSIAGNTLVTANQGMFNFSGITFTAEPGVSYSKLSY